MSARNSLTGGAYELGEGFQLLGKDEKVDEAGNKQIAVVLAYHLDGAQPSGAVEDQDLFTYVLRTAVEGRGDIQVTIQEATFGYTGAADPCAATIEGGSAVTTVMSQRYDLDLDGDFDEMDLVAACGLLSAQQGDADWTEASIADVDGNGVVDLADLVRDGQRAGREHQRLRHRNSRGGNRPAGGAAQAAPPGISGGAVHEQTEQEHTIPRDSPGAPGRALDGPAHRRPSHRRGPAAGAGAGGRAPPAGRRGSGADRRPEAAFCGGRGHRRPLRRRPGGALERGPAPGKPEIEVEILSGPHKGAVLETVNYLSAYANVDCRLGTRVIVRLDYDDNGSPTSSRCRITTGGWFWRECWWYSP